MFFHSINWVCSKSLVDLKQMKNWWNDDRHIQIVGSTLERWFINKSNYYDDVKRKDARKHALTRSLAYLLVHTHLHVIHKRREYTIKFSQGSGEWIKRRSQKRAGGKKIASKALFINLTVRSTQHSTAHNTRWNECKRANLSWVSKWSEGSREEKNVTFEKKIHGIASYRR